MISAYVYIYRYPYVQSLDVRIAIEGPETAYAEKKTGSVAYCKHAPEMMGRYINPFSTAVPFWG